MLTGQNGRRHRGVVIGVEKAYFILFFDTFAWNSLIFSGQLMAKKNTSQTKAHRKPYNSPKKGQRMKGAEKSLWMISLTTGSGKLWGLVAAHEEGLGKWNVKIFWIFIYLSSVF